MSDRGDQPPPAGTCREHWHFDLAASLAFVEDDLDLLRAVSEVFVEEAPRLVSGAEDALQAGDLDQLQHAAHTLKATFNTLSLEAMRQLSQTIETLAAAGRLAEAAPLVQTLRQRTDQILSQLNRDLAL